MRRAILVTAAIAVAVIFFLLATLPPRPVVLSLDGADPDLVRRTVRGAYHIHTTRSDGAEDKAAVAAAASRAGLQFAIFTEHGDATAVPDPPQYLSGVLCLDGVEISTNGGHYVALGMPASPYPLGGEPGDVVEDVARLGGFGIAAHPDHPKPSLAWTDWTAPVDGLEWLNADAEWRDENPVRLARVLFDYLVRPAGALASTLDRPQATLERWAALARTRQVVGLAAADAHGGVRAREEDGGGVRSGGPSYEASFRAFSNVVLLDQPFSGDAAADGRGLLDALRRGRAYTVIDAIAGPALVTVGARAVSDSGEGPVLGVGDRAPASPRATFAITVAGFIPSSPIVPRAAFGGVPVRRASGEQGAHPVANASGGEPLTAGGQFFEVPVEGAPGDPPIPWILTNPIYFLPPNDANPGVSPAPSAEALAVEWRIESDGRSEASVARTDGGAAVEYTLAGGARGNQFVALVSDLQRPLAAFTDLVFNAAASRPMRLSVQLRYPPDDRRWRKSIYLDTNPRDVTVRVAQMVAADGPPGPPPAAETARSLLFVVDLVNARPGDRGEFVIRGVRAARR